MDGWLIAGAETLLIIFDVVVPVFAWFTCRFTKYFLVLRNSFFLNKII
jgi:hypothetical protein